MCVEQGIVGRCPMSIKLAITACIVDFYLEDKRQVDILLNDYETKIVNLDKVIAHQKQLILCLQLENCNLKTKPVKKSKRSKK